MSDKRTMTLNLNDAEMAALEQLAARKELSKTAVIRQALRLYQLVRERVIAGETMHFSGDKERMVMFVGPDFAAEPNP